jgi:hypothetical protein
MIVGSFACDCANSSCSALYELTNHSIGLDTTTFCKERTFASQVNLKPHILLSVSSIDNYKLKIPLLMLLDPRSFFGCPDCLDKGGYYLGFTIVGITRHFEYDENPFYFENLLQQTQSKLEQLKSFE